MIEKDSVISIKGLWARLLELFGDPHPELDESHAKTRYEMSIRR